MPYPYDELIEKCSNEPGECANSVLEFAQENPYATAAMTGATLLTLFALRKAPNIVNLARRTCAFNKKNLNYLDSEQESSHENSQGNTQEDSIDESNNPISGYTENKPSATSADDPEKLNEEDINAEEKGMRLRKRNK